MYPQDQSDPSGRFAELFKDNSGPRRVAGFVGALVAGFLGMMGWFLLIHATGYEVGYAAWGVGVLIGFVTLRAAREPDQMMGIIAAAVAVVAIIGGQYLALNYGVKQQLRKMADEAYPRARAFAARVCAAEDEGARRQCIAEINCAADEEPDPASVSDEQLASFVTDIRPEYQSLLDGKPSREEWAENLASEIMGNVPFSAILKESVGLWTILWLLLGVGSAYKIASGLSRQS